METTTTRQANNDGNESSCKKIFESIEQAEIRRHRERDRAAWRRQNETPDQTLKRREKERERAARRRRNEDPIQTALRLQRDRERAARRRRNEHPEETLIRLKRERERTAERRRIRKAILPPSSSSSSSEKDGLFTNSNNTTTQQDFLLQFTKKDEEKMMAPFIQSELYQDKCSPIIGDISAASSSIRFCSSPVRDISSNFSTDDNNLLSSQLRPQFLSVLSKHHCMLMTNLATFWKNGQYCDAAIEAENCKILVHKLLLLAISPRLQCEVQVPIISFLTVKFSQGVNQAGLNAFADYLYNGILSLNSSLLLQLQIMAKQLGIKELELLCENQLGSSDTQSNVQQTDSLLAANSDVSISFAEGNFNIKKESFMDESSDYCADSVSELVSINQTFPSEKAINPINHIHHDEEDNLLSDHIPHFQETENHFEKKHLTLSQTSAQCHSALLNETEMKDFGNFVQNSSRIELKTSNLNSYPPKAQNLCPIEQGSTMNSSLTL